VPVPGKERAQRDAEIKGEAPSAANPPSGCRFHPRCPDAMPVCQQTPPELRRFDDREVLCHLY